MLHLQHNYVIIILKKKQALGDKDEKKNISRIIINKFYNDEYSAGMCIYSFGGSKR